MKPVPSAPSDDRIAAQGAKSNSPQSHHPIPLLAPNKRFHRKDPSSTKPLKRSKTLHEPDNTESPDLQASLPMPPDNNLQSPKGVFKTTKHGIVKHKNTRYFLCPVCGIHKTMTSSINVHYRNRHKPLKCAKCSMVFNTPSALARHRYTHQKPTRKAKEVQCTKCDYRSKDKKLLKSHMQVHEDTVRYQCKTVAKGFDIETKYVDIK